MGGLLDQKYLRWPYKRHIVSSPGLFISGGTA
jgi:hypothetical protein